MIADRPRGRPRTLDMEYVELAQGRHKPSTIEHGVRILRGFWIPFLQKEGVASEDVTIHTLIDFEEELLAHGLSAVDGIRIARIRGFYLLKGNRYPDSKWSKLAGEIKARKAPVPIGRRNPHEPFELTLVPKILEVARNVVQVNGLGDPAYSEVFPVVATFVYTGGRAQFYGLRVDQVQDAIKKKVLDLYVKRGKAVRIPIHDRLLEIWRHHLEARDFDGPQLFRHGRSPYTYQDGNLDWTEDAKSAGNNGHAVTRMLLCVQRGLKTKFNLKEHLTSHRFRKTLGTYCEQYGFTIAERNVLGAWEGQGMAEKYAMPSLLELQKKWSSVDFGSESWVRDHWPPRNLFVGGDDGSASRIAQLEAQLQEQRDRNDRLEEKLDRILANQGRVIA